MSPVKQEVVVAFKVAITWVAERQGSIPGIVLGTAPLQVLQNPVNILGTPSSLP